MSKIYKNINNKRKPAEVFNPGIYINDELKARGWSIKKFSDMTNLSIDNIKSILHGDEVITPEIATILSKTLVEACTKLVKILSAITKINVKVDITKIEKLVCIDKRMMDYSTQKLKEIIDEIK